MSWYSGKEKIESDITLILTDTTDINQHVDYIQRVYPSLANGNQVDTSDVAWGMGDFRVLVPTSTIIGEFDLTLVYINTMSANGEYQLNLYTSDAEATSDDTFVSTIVFHREANKFTSEGLPLHTKGIVANKGIWGRLASSTATSDTCQVTFGYHKYI